MLLGRIKLLSTLRVTKQNSKERVDKMVPILVWNSKILILYFVSFFGYKTYTVQMSNEILLIVWYIRVYNMNYALYFAYSFDVDE